MSFKTRAAAVASLREFVPSLREKHRIIRFWSTQDNAWRWCRQLIT